jgi:hypothetical protein
MSAMLQNTTTMTANVCGFRFHSLFSELYIQLESAIIVHMHAINHTKPCSKQKSNTHSLENFKLEESDLGPWGAS